MGAKTWSVDRAGSALCFSARHLMISKVQGRFRDFSVTLALDEGDLEDSSVRVTVRLASVDTMDEARDENLRGPEFFDAERFPEATFVSTRVEGKGRRFRLFGDLSLHGVAKEVTLDVERKEATAVNQRFVARATLRRTEFGLRWSPALEAGGVLVGEKIDLEIELKAQLSSGESTDGPK
jgi:polyisoprenoid-binding protein YceI